MKRIAILGGGLSGVSAAWQLAQERKADFALYEATHRLGGIVETERRDGFVIECGPDSWVSEKPWAHELAIELGLEGEILPSKDYQRRTYLLENGQLVPMPVGMRMMVPTDLEPIRRSPLFSPAAIEAYENEPRRAEELKRSALPEGEDESVARFVRRHFGDEATETLAGPLLAGVFGGSVERLSVRAVMPAFVKMEREQGSLILALQNGALQNAALQQQSRRSAESTSIFTTLRSGLGTLIDRMAAAIPSSSIRLNTEVIAVSRESGRWVVATAAGSEAYHSLIVATPAHVTRRLLAPLDPAFDTLLDMEATSAIVVALAFAPEIAGSLTIPGGFGFLVPQHGVADPEEEPSLLACTFVDQKFAHRAHPGGVLLRAFYGGEAAAGLLSESDDRLKALAHRQLAKILGPLPDPSMALVRRWPRSLPQYAVGHLDRMERLATFVEGLPGLALVGNAYHGVGLPDMVRQGRAAARRFSDNA